MMLAKHFSLLLQLLLIPVYGGHCCPYGRDNKEVDDSRRQRLEQKITYTYVRLCVATGIFRYL